MEKMFKPLISSKNVDAIYINDEYQDESKQLDLSENGIIDYRCSIRIKYDNRVIKIIFHSAEDLQNFVKAYHLE